MCRIMGTQNGCHKNDAQLAQIFSKWRRKHTQRRVKRRTNCQFARPFISPNALGWLTMQHRRAQKQNKATETTVATTSVDLMCMLQPNTYARPEMSMKPGKASKCAVNLDERILVDDGDKLGLFLRQILHSGIQNKTISANVKLECQLSFVVVSTEKGALFPVRTEAGNFGLSTKPPSAWETKPQLPGLHGNARGCSRSCKN